MAFLKDEKLRGREEKLAQEELAAAQEKLARLTDRKEIVWNDYVRIQELSKLEEEPAKKEFEALSVRLEELQKEAQRLQEEMEQEEALRKKGRERKAQVRKSWHKTGSGIHTCKSAQNWQRVFLYSTVKSRNTRRGRQMQSRNSS